MSIFHSRWQPIAVHPDITVITTATPDTISRSYLIKQLEASHVPYINSAEGFTSEWKRTDKLRLINEALTKVLTPYVLILDANDVTILRDIDDEFIETFKEFNANLVFNASEYLYPKLFNHPKEEPSVFCQHYLNAGVVFGNVGYARKLYAHALWQSGRDEYPTVDSEQYYIRIAWVKYSNCEVDKEHKLFLLSHGN